MPVPGEPFHVITTGDVMRKLESMERDLSEIKSKLSRIDVHSEKIRALEIKVYGLVAGLVAALGLLIWGGWSA